MTRCVACNKNLSDQESTRKSVTTGEYIDLCNNCFSTISDEVPSIEGSLRSESPDDEDFEIEETDERLY